MNQTISLQVSKDLLSLLKDTAYVNGMNVSSLIRYILLSYFNEESDVRIHIPNNKQ